MNKKSIQENKVEPINIDLAHKIVPTAVIGGLSYLLYKLYKDQKKQKIFEKALGKERYDLDLSSLNYY